MNITTDTAKTIQIDHPQASYGIFCYNSRGDLFLSSDWGFHSYSWRSFGAHTFESFLSQCNSDYIIGKFQVNHGYLGVKIHPNQKKNLAILIDEFIKALKEESSKNEISNS